MEEPNAQFIPNKPVLKQINAATRIPIASKNVFLLNKTVFITCYRHEDET